MYAIVDIEADNLLDDITKIHCLSYQILDKNLNRLGKGSIIDYKDIIDFYNSQDIIVGHNFIRYDKPASEKVLNTDMSDITIYDTLAISHYLYPYKNRHGLEFYGDELGVEKPKVEDWVDGDITTYIHRCETDVEINTLLFIQQMDYLNKLYQDPSVIIKYLGFKMECLREQEKVGITLDRRLCDETFLKLEYIFAEKINALSKVMPKIPIKFPPKVLHKKDGTLSANGLKWLNTLEQLKLPKDSEAIYESGNPGSNKQLKDWLLTLGWKPETFKESKATGKQVPQVSLPMGAGICGSVKKIYDIEPELENIEGLYVAKHRLGIVKSFKENVKNGKLYATAHGLTNTLRMKHKVPLVNLPGYFKPFGKEIRGCLTVPNDDYIMIGSDIGGVEDNTKKHYMYNYDPEYVKTMDIPGFDGHLDIAVFAGLLTEEEVNLYKSLDSKDKSLFSVHETIEYNRIKQVRAEAKTVNFGGVYGIGPSKLATQLDISLSKAKALHTAYWERNKAVKLIAENVNIRTVNSQKWLYNPISGFWMYLKADKDRFSTLNQSSAVYVFDLWLYNIKQEIDSINSCNVVMQYHDEVLLVLHKDLQDKVSDIITKAMEKVNEQLKLNVTIGISIDVGDNYAVCH